ncbi:diguanylate cyclase [Vulgatibacter sp.]|uniref:sensor domain-containing diguanylate cyclase n=1 Tax=Vulgatibacter sp. TaxID=1971226 RepID=UPI0035618335
MKPPARRALRTVARVLPALVGLLAAWAVAGGRFSDLAALGLQQGLLLLALLASITFLGWRRVQRVAREIPSTAWEEAEIGALLLVAGHALAQPLGGVDSPLHPVLYLLMAFLVAFLPARVGIGLTAFAVLLDVAIFAGADLLESRWETLLSHAVFLVIFAGLYRVVFAAQEFGGAATGRLAERTRLRDVQERARQYRLGLHAGEDEPVDEGKWLTAAVKEVEEAVGNALEVAECALRTHTVAVFLLAPDDRTIKLHDCRSLADDVLRDPFEAHEGIVGAVLKRRMPMRLCGEIKGVTWYGGRKAVRSVLAVPLIDRRGAGLPGNDEGFVRGLLVADRLEATPFSDDDERLLAATSREVLRAIEIERVMGYIRRARDEKEQFYAAIEELNRCSKIDEVLDTAIRLARGVTQLDLVAFTTRFEDDDGRVRHRVEKVAGMEKFAQLQGYEFGDNTGLVANAIRYEAVLPGRELKLLERPQIFDAATQVRGLQTLKIVPVRAGGEAIGSLVCATRRRRALDGDAVRMLQVIALQAGEAFLRARLFAQTERMATTDGLTGLLNHRTFQAKFDEELARAARTGRKVSLILTDIDHFKSVNDTYGHATGDAVLRGVAKLLQRCARSTDVVARYGGEEFAIVLPETDMAGGKIIAERIREAVLQHEFQTDLGPLKCTLSLGIATYPDVSEVKQELFEKTDQCLYHCKRMGRNRSTTVDEMRRSEQQVDAA